MPKDEWGVKRLCPHCASRFFDLKKDPMTCPECGQTFAADSLVAGRGRVLTTKEASPRDKVEEDTEVVDTEVELDDDSDDSDLDDDLLEDDEDDDVSLDEIADVATKDDDN